MAKAEDSFARIKLGGWRALRDEFTNSKIKRVRKQEILPAVPRALAFEYLRRDICRRLTSKETSSLHESDQEFG